jgi:hypothetical protein
MVNYVYVGKIATTAISVFTQALWPPVSSGQKLLIASLPASFLGVALL